ncbi:MAG: hypothetical protein KGH63_04070, partial [Candidatus Micrarchaeota archaeon]|nr:hypothetical protein [Candidatus Micrarchaeota archaeon]
MDSSPQSGTLPDSSPARIPVPAPAARPAETAAAPAGPVTSPSAPAPPAAKKSAPWAPLLAWLKSISIYSLTLALLLLNALAAWLVISPASRIPALITLAVAAAACGAAEAVLGWWAGPTGLWPSKPKQAVPSAPSPASASASAAPRSASPPSLSPIDAVPKRAWRLSSTSLICGLIIGSILAPETSPLLVAAIALMAIVIKRLLHEGPVPVFNPAAAALVIGGLAFGTLDIWWASVSSGIGLLILIAAVLLLSWRQNRWRMELAFLVAWLAGWALFQHLPPLSASLSSLNVLVGLLP